MTEALIERFPLLKQLIALQETQWFNPNITTLAEGLPHVGLSEQDVQDAAARLRRFAPYIEHVFPETAVNQGIIESPLVTIDHMRRALQSHYQTDMPGKLLLKLDSHLPISGSIKARGGIYEVLAHAEQLALQAGLLHLEDDYRTLASDELRHFFSQHQIAVGSTGNLGLSIGIMSAKLGFRVTVHMSADAREWKKAKLRSHGVTVVEYDSDYGVAVEQGRAQAQNDPSCFFIDDETPARCFWATRWPVSASKRNWHSAKFASTPITRCLFTCRAAWAVARAALPLASNSRLAITCTACLPNQLTRRACCLAYTPVCTMPSACKIWASITSPQLMVSRSGGHRVLSAAPWNACSMAITPSATKRYLRC